MIIKGKKNKKTLLDLEGFLSEEIIGKEQDILRFQKTAFPTETSKKACEYIRNVTEEIKLDIREVYGNNFKKDDYLKLTEVIELFNKKKDIFERIEELRRQLRRISYKDVNAASQRVRLEIELDKEESRYNEIKNEFLKRYDEVVSIVVPEGMEKIKNDIYMIRAENSKAIESEIKILQAKISALNLLKAESEGQIKRCLCEVIKENLGYMADKIIETEEGTKIINLFIK